MKTKFSLLIILLMSAPALYGQIKYNISAGLNYSNSIYNNVIYLQTKYRPGFYISASPEFQLSEKLSIPLELQFSQQSYEFKYLEEIRKNNYLRLIPQIEYKPFKKLGISAGPSISYNFSDKINSNNLGWENYPSYLSNPKWDLGINLGLKYYIKNFFVSLSYNQGLSDLKNYEYFDLQGNKVDAKQKNRSFQFGVGFRF